LQISINGVVAIGGKTLCNSGDEDKDIRAIHVVSAFATETRLVLGQQKVDEKSNEITAIPLLLDLLDLKGTTVTLDAIGCQKEIAKKIREKEADYVLALKGNQGTLNEGVRLFLETEFSKKEISDLIDDRYEETEAGHGRIEERKCIVSSQIDWLKQKSEWADIKTVVMIEETRDTGKKCSVERRFYISSLSADAKRIAAAVREHWLVENALHWTLDVVFNEDGSCIRKEYAAQNMAIVRPIALNRLGQAKKHFNKDIGIKALRKKAGWGNDTLELTLKQNF